MTMMNQFMLAMNRHRNTFDYVALGTITSCDATSGWVKVMIGATQTELGPMPFGTMFYGWYSPPVGGEQCIVLFQNGSKSNPIGALLLYWDNHLPPANVNNGEVMMLHSSGSRLYLSNDGKVNLNGNVEIDITAPKVVITTTGDVDVNAGGNASISSALCSVNASVKAAVTAPNVTLSNGGATDSLVTFTQFQTWINSHQHSGVQTGTGTSGAPTTSIPTSAKTTVVKGQ